MVLHGHLTFFRHEGNVVAFFRNLLGVPVLSKEGLAKRTQEYNRWVAAFARKQKCPLQWAQPGQRKEDWVRPTLDRRRARQQFGVYFILMSMEQGPSFRISPPKFLTGDPNYRILRAHRSRYRHYSFYIYDRQLGAFCLRVGSVLPFPATAYVNGHEFIARELTRRKIHFTQRENSFTDVADVKALQAAADRFGPSVLRLVLTHWALAVGPKFSKKERIACQGLPRYWAVQQVEYCLNFIFKKNWPIRRLFERCCELSLYLIGADRIGQLFGARASRRINGKLQNVMERASHSYRYRLTLKGQKAATLMTLLRKRIYGPISASTFHHRPALDLMPNSPFERAHAKVDKALDELLLALAA